VRLRGCLRRLLGGLFGMPSKLPAPTTPLGGEATRWRGGGAAGMEKRREVGVSVGR
jgi:hypothetical protein